VKSELKCQTESAKLSDKLKLKKTNNDCGIYR